MKEAVCPACRSAAMIIGVKRVDLKTGKKIVGQGGVVASILGLAVGLFLVTTFFVVLVQSGFMLEQAIEGGLLLVFGGLIVRATASILLEFRKADRASLYTYRCRKCRHTWKQLEEGARPDLKSLVAGLNDADAGIRSQAAIGIAELGVHEVEPEMITALKDESEAVRLSVVDALGKLGSTSAVETLSHTVVEDTHAVQLAAAKVIARYGDTNGVSAICRAIQETREESKKRDFLDKALTSINNPACVELLVQAMNGGDSILRRFASENLTNMDDKIVREAMRRASGDSADEIRQVGTPDLEKTSK